MRVFRLAVTNVGAFWRRFLGLAIVAAVGTGICLPLLSIAAEAQAAAHDRITEGVLLRSIELVRQDDRPEDVALNPDAIAKIATVPGIESVEPSLRATIGIKSQDIAGALLYATLARPSRLPPIVQSTRPNLFPLTGDEAVLPAQAQGMDLTSLLGERVTIDYQQTIGVGSGRGVQDHVTVVGFYRPDWQIDGADSAYVSEAPLLKWASSVAGVPSASFLQTHGYDKATVVAKTAADVPNVLKALQQRGYSATSLEQQLSALPSILRLIQIVSRVLTGALIIFTLFGAATLSGSLVRQRTREIGLLKAVGYQNSAVSSMLLGELAIVGLVAGAFGYLIGVGGGYLLNGWLANAPDLALYVGDRVLPPSTVLILLLLTPAVAMVIGGLLPIGRGARMEPSLALRDW
jgi:putative ABC transport system permease protein